MADLDPDVAKVVKIVNTIPDIRPSPLHQMKHRTSTITSLTSFDTFSKLPTELRHSIYRHAFPTRILQLGVDFPYPKFTGLEDACYPLRGNSTTNCSAYPTPTYLPALFHACRESRALCLEVYIPFAYSYAHPSLDTLFISPKAGRKWFDDAESEGASAPLYPLALLDRVAVYFDPLDTDVLWNGGDQGFNFQEALRLLGYYGVPKELLLVGVTGCWNEDGDWEARQGFEIVDSVVDLVELAPQESLYAAATGFVEGSAEVMMADYQDCVPWWRLRVPALRITCVVGQRAFVKKRNESEDGTRMRLLKAGQRLAREWTDDTQAINRRDWSYDLDGNLYSPDNMNKQLARHGKENLMLDLATLEKLRPFTAIRCDFSWSINPHIVSRKVVIRMPPGRCVYTQ